MVRRDTEPFVTVTESTDIPENYYDFTESVEKARNGDVSAFETLYWKSFPYLETEAKKYFRLETDREDALQETYLRIYDKLGTLKDPKKFLGWAITVCTRTCQSKAGKDARYENREMLLPELSEEDTAGMDLLPAEEYRKDGNPDAALNAAVVTDTVRSILEDLPDNQKTCVLLWASGYTQSDIARELDMPLGTVKSNITYAKKKVTRTLNSLQKEGRFDYHAVHGDPMGAFLLLLERYLAGAPAVPPSAETLLPKIQTAVAAGGSAGAIGVGAEATAAKVAFSSLPTAFQKFMSDTGAVVTSLMLVIALSIGAALSIQNLSSNLPVAPTNASPTKVKQMVDTTTTTQTTVASQNAGSGEANTGTNRQAPTATVTVPAATTRVAETARTSRTNETTATERAVAAASESAPLVATVVDVSEIPNFESLNNSAQLGSTIADNITVKDPVIDSELAYQGNGNETGLYLYLFTRNHLGEDIVIYSIPDLVIKSLLGTELLHQEVIFQPPVNLDANEEQWFRIIVPYDSLKDDRVRAQLESGLFRTTFEYNYSVK